MASADTAVELGAPEAGVFGALLRRHREAAGLSQEDLAERAGLTAKAISALERGERRRPYPHTVQVLAEALSLDATHRAAFIAAIRRHTSARDESARDGQPPGTAISRGGQAALAGSHLAVHSAGPRTSCPLPRDSLATPAALAPSGREVSAFVGRRDELAVLQSRLAAAAAAQGSVVVLVGEAGIGKTRLARELAATAAAQGALVLWGSCFEGDWHPAYGPWIEALGAYAASVPLELLERQLGASAGPIARLVPDVQAALPRVPAPEPLSPDEARYRLHDAIIRFLLTIAADQALVLVLDDLQWADPDSLRLLCHLTRFLGRVCLLAVCTYRDPEFGLAENHALLDALSVLGRAGGAGRLALGGFSRDEVAEYLANAAGQPLPQALVRAIEEETGGNPFYAGEVFRHLTEEAKLLLRDGRWSTDRSIGDLGIPDGVRNVVGRRVARLTEETRAVLRLAAGFAAGFAFDVLHPLSGLSEDTLLDCLDEALQAGLIRVGDQSPPRYAFAHAIVRHTLYEALTPDRRARLHRRIAETLEQVHGAAGDDWEEAAELAAQYRASAVLPGAAKGVPHALRAAQRAREAYAYGREAGFLRLALDLATDSPAGERADMLHRLAIAEAEAVELDRAPQTTAAALEAMEAAGEAPREQAAFLARIARALKEGGATASVWEPLVERGLALAGDARDLLWARLALLRDRFEVLRSGPVGGTRWLGSDQEAVAVAERFGSLPNQAEALAQLATTQIATGDLRRAPDTVARVQAAVGRLGAGHRMHQFVPISRAVGLAYFLDGDWPLLAVAATQYAVSAGAARSPVGVVAAAFAAASACRAGQVAEARALLPHITVLIERATPTTYAQSVAVAAAVLAVWDLEEARYAATYRRLAWELKRAGTGDCTFGPVELVLARMAALLGEYADAYAYFEQARQRTTASNLGHVRAIVDYDEVCARFRAGDADHPRTLALLDAATETFRSYEMQGWVARAAARREQLAAVRGTATVNQAPAIAAARGAERTADAPAGQDGRVGLHVAGLTAREVEVLGLLAAGKTNKEIAAALVVSVPTAERHVTNIYGKIGAGKRYDAVAFARSHGIGVAGPP